MYLHILMKTLIWIVEIICPTVSYVNALHLNLYYLLLYDHNINMAEMAVFNVVGNIK